ncbi:MAG: ribonuclease HII [Rhodobacteraceae bacterium]|nr:ribonuclease HII [Paracoccaceae bacterium]
MPRPLPDLSRETRLIAAGSARVAGIDEVGRGPLAGPVLAAAVVLDPARLPPGLADSKTLRPARRAELAAALHTCAEIGIGMATVEEIDSLNILRATHLAMCRALAALPAPVDVALIDGNSLPAGLACPAETVVGGDAHVLSIAAASIVAKVARDRIMTDLACLHPGYGWERNAGYGTKEHLLALKRLGPSPAHRRSFRPVHNILCELGSISP